MCNSEKVLERIKEKLKDHCPIEYNYKNMDSNKKLVYFVIDNYDTVEDFILNGQSDKSMDMFLSLMSDNVEITEFFELVHHYYLVLEQSKYYKEFKNKRDNLCSSIKFQQTQ